MSFNDLSSPIDLLLTRRSAKPRDLVAPGPSDDELRTILRAAMRVPDHGKLAPWRFVVIDDAARAAFRDLLLRAYRTDCEEPTDKQREAVEAFAAQAPVLVIVLYAPQPAKIPEWEQQLSVGAACMNLLNATSAMGYVGGWVTPWAAYSDAVRDAFGSGDERIAGFFFIGSPGQPLEERPRPAFDDVVTYWRG